MGTIAGIIIGVLIMAIVFIVTYYGSGIVIDQFMKTIDALKGKKNV